MIPDESLQTTSYCYSKPIIDCHLHVGCNYYSLYKEKYPTTQNIYDLSMKLKRNNVSFGCLSPMPSTLYYDQRILAEKNIIKKSKMQNFPYEIENKTLIREINKHGHNFVPFVCINPNEGIEEQINLIENISNENRIYGFKFHPITLHCEITKLIDTEFIRYAQKHNIPFQIHSGDDPYSNPYDILNISKEYPNINFCIAHFGRFNKSFLETIFCSSPANLYFDLAPFLVLVELARLNFNSGHFHDLVLETPEKIIKIILSKLAKNVIWGTDEPFTQINEIALTDSNNDTYTTEVNFLKSLDTNIKNSISFTNTLKYLNCTEKDIQQYLG